MNSKGLFVKVRVALFLLVALFTVSTAWAVKSTKTIEYIDENGVAQTRDNYCYIYKTNEDGVKECVGKSGWYVVQGTPKFYVGDEAGVESPFKFQEESDTSGITGPDVKIILREGSNLTINLKDNEKLEFRNLTVYTGTGMNTNGSGVNTGKLVIKGNSSGKILDVDKNLKIYGAQVIVINNSADKAARSIVADSIIIGGGTLDANKFVDGKVVLAGGTLTTANAPQFDQTVIIKAGLEYRDSVGTIYYDHLDSDVPANKKFSVNPVTYLDAQGFEKSITQYYMLRGGESSEVFQGNSVFVVKGNVSYENGQFAFAFNKDNYDTTKVVGPDVDLILLDGAKLSVNNSEYVPSIRNLNIYAQSNGENRGEFKVVGSHKNYNNAALWVFDTLSLYGGSVDISDAADITSLMVGSQYGDGGKIIINGGSLTAGMVDGYVELAGGISKVDYYLFEELTIKDGFVYTDGENSYSGVISDEECDAVRGKTLSLKPIPYLDENGKEQVVTEYYVLTGNESAEDFKNNVWYVVNSSVSYDDDRFAFNGQNINLILADSANLTVRNSSHTPSFGNLSIYAQSTGDNMGLLNVESGDSVKYAMKIEGDFTFNGGVANIRGINGISCDSSVTINGGEISVQASPEEGAIALYGGKSVVINDGSVVVFGYFGMYGNDDGVTINDGKVRAYAIAGVKEPSECAAIGRYGDVVINDGIVEVVTGNEYCHGIAVYGSKIEFNGGYFATEGDGAGLGVFRGSSSSTAELAGAVVEINGIDVDGAPTVYFKKGVYYKDEKGGTYEDTLYYKDENDETIDKRESIVGKRIHTYVPPMVLSEYVEYVMGKPVNHDMMTIDGHYDNVYPVNIKEERVVDSVAIARTFTPGAYATVVFPFDLGVDQISDDCQMVATLASVKKNADTGKWDTVAVKKIWEKTKGDTSESVQLKAYQPYMVLTKNTNLRVFGPVTFVPTADAELEYKIDDEWTMVSTLGYKKWTEEDEDMNNRFIYGFAGENVDGAKIGQFVRGKAGAYINPLRAYLKYTPLEMRSKPTALRSTPANKPKMTASNDEYSDLPDVLTVVVLDADENGEEHTTVIGRINTRTGEFKMIPNFDLKGRNVQGKAKARGAYYGKKTIR